MIPMIVPPLTALSVLVTRPSPQGATLASGITALGGEAIVFPSIAIEPLAAVEPSPHDLVIFVSVHAVEYGARFIRKSETLRIAAIGKATAAALTAIDLAPDIVPLASATSEGLLDHEALRNGSWRNVLIVRGAGGRETLRETFVSQGARVATLDVYRRVLPQVSAQDVESLETRWADAGIDIVTATSVETYLNLDALLCDRGRALLRAATLLAPSQRVIDAAGDHGWRGEALISGGADDASILGTLARWRTRARAVRQ